MKTPEVRSTVKIPLEISSGGNVVEIVVNLHYIKEAYHPGKLSVLPENCFPPEGGGIEFQDIEIDYKDLHRKILYLLETSPTVEEDINEDAESEIDYLASKGL